MPHRIYDGFLRCQAENQIKKIFINGGIFTMKVQGRFTGKKDAWGNQYVKGNDGYYYKTDGKTMWDTPETARLRAEEEPKKPEKEPSQDPIQTGPSAYDRAIDGLASEAGNAFVDAAKMTGKTILAIIALGTFFAAGRTYAKAIAENPHDIEGARAKSRRTILCGIGIVANLILLFVFAFIFDAIEIPAVHTLGSVVLIFQLYTFYGLVRVAGGKAFLINPATICRKIRSTRVPKIAYVGIELLTTALMTKPVLNFINSFTIEWAAQHQDADNSLIITLGLIMLIASVIIAAVIGWIVCKLVKAVTAQ